MIVRAVDDILLLITQPDHAHVAAAIMEQCVPLAAHLRRDAILHAIREHDNGWEEEDAAPRVDPATASVLDFVHAPVSVRHGVWPRGVARLSADPWAAALVAQHALTVYERYRPDPAWTQFFAGMEARRNELLRAGHRPLDDLLADYAFVRLADLISLVFCTAWTEEQRFGEWNVRLLGSRVIVTPDLFGGQTIPIAITARRIYNRPYRSNQDLREALDASTTVSLRGEVAAPNTAAPS